jgi:hypothetical protein
VYVLHADHDRWGEGNKAALMMPSLKALGVGGSLRRLWGHFLGLFRRRKPADAGSPASGQP